jgi:hypothetical protein
VGVRQKPLSVKKLSVKKLVNVIVEPEASDVIEHARDISQRIDEEDDVSNSNALIESHFIKFNSNNSFAQ